MNGLIMSQFRIVVRYHLLHGLLILVALESQTERKKTLKKTRARRLLDVWASTIGKIVSVPPFSLRSRPLLRLEI